MGSYLVLRDCYVGEVFRARGTTCELPDALDKSPKNFQLAEGTGVVAWEATGVAGDATGAVTDSPMRTRPLAVGEYLCSKCSKIHRGDSKIGVRHLIHYVEAP